MKEGGRVGDRCRCRGGSIMVYAKTREIVCCQRQFSYVLVGIMSKVLYDQQTKSLEQPMGFLPSLMHVILTKVCRPKMCTVQPRLNQLHPSYLKVYLYYIKKWFN